MNRLAFALPGLGSLGFFVLFVVSEFESPGLSIAVALVWMTFAFNLLGNLKSASGRIGGEARIAGLAAITIALAAFAYIAVFFDSWFIWPCAWLALHIPMVVAIGRSRAPDSR
jgi:hypothetical protein